jgi:hypothetical protein
MQTANRAYHIMFIILAWRNSSAIPNNNTNQEISEEGGISCRTAEKKNIKRLTPVIHLGMQFMQPRPRRDQASDVYVNLVRGCEEIQIL